MEPATKRSSFTSQTPPPLNSTMLPRIALLAVFACALPLFERAASARSGCEADLNDDGTVGAADLVIVLGAWGGCQFQPCVGDLNGDLVVNAVDLFALLDAWDTPCGPPPWWTVIEQLPDPAVVTDAGLREDIIATGLPWRVRDNGTQIEMLLVPPGTFDMGCSPSTSNACQAEELPVHPVTLTRPFYLGRYEVTQSQWTAMMGSNPSFFANAADSPNRPVERVSGLMIESFLVFTGLRLPTEAEWEFAYRAGTTTAFHSMPDAPQGTNSPASLGSIAWFLGNNGPSGSPTFGTKAVGTRAANALGLHDMSGNVLERTSDWYSPTYYASSPSVDPTGPAKGTLKAVRGGIWFDGSNGLRASYRSGMSMSFIGSHVGVRVARSP